MAGANRGKIIGSSLKAMAQNFSCLQSKRKTRKNINCMHTEFVCTKKYILKLRLQFVRTGLFMLTSLLKEPAIWRSIHSFFLDGKPTHMKFEW